MGAGLLPQFGVGNSLDVVYFDQHLGAAPPNAGHYQSKMPQIALKQWNFIEI